MNQTSSRIMSSRERILAATRGHEVDRVPCTISFNPLYPVQRTAWNFPWPQDASLEDRYTYQVEELGLDQVVTLGADLCRPADGVTWHTWIEDGLLHKSYQTPAGELHAAVRYNELWAHGEDIPLMSDFNVGHFAKPWIQNEQDLECLKYVLRFDDSETTQQPAREFAARMRRIADRHGLATMAYCGEGLTGAMKMFGAEPLCLMVRENPDLVDAFVEYEHRINLRRIETAASWGIDLIRRNGFYETADFYGPAMLERFVGRRLREEQTATRAAGMLFSYNVHTGVMPILDYLAALDLDSIFGIDIAFHGVNLELIRAKLGRRSLWIGPSSTYHLWAGPEVTRQAVRQTFDVFGRERGFVLTPGVSAHCVMPWESTLALIDEWKKWR